MDEITSQKSLVLFNKTTMREIDRVAGINTRGDMWNAISLLQGRHHELMYYEDGLLCIEDEHGQLFKVYRWGEIVKCKERTLLLRWYWASWVMALGIFVLPKNEVEAKFCLLLLGFIANAVSF